jgi:hypothetical protein
MANQPFFHVVDPANAQYLGGYPAKNDADLCSGKLVELNSDGSMQPAVAATKPHGFCFNNRTLTYAPTSYLAAQGEYVTLITGDILALVGKDLFVGGTLPSFDDPLYSAAGGLMDTQGTNAIGKVIGHENLRAVPNTSEDVVLIQCHFSGKDL